MVDLFKIMILCILEQIILAQPNYQQRVIYYTPDDNVCSHGEYSDRIYLNISIDDRFTLKRNVYGSTFCSQQEIRPEKAITPA